MVLMESFIFISVLLVDMYKKQKKKELTKIRIELLRLKKNRKLFKSVKEYVDDVNQSTASFFKISSDV